MKAKTSSKSETNTSPKTKIYTAV